MKLSELRPCDNCGGPVGTTFNILRHSIVAVNAEKANRVLGMAQFFQGHLGLAEVMGPEDNPVIIAGEFNPVLWTDLFICQDCYYQKHLSIPSMMENRVNKIAADVEARAQA